MKIKTSVMLAVIGTVLIIVSRVGTLLGAFSSSVELQFIPGLINILGDAFVAIFFIIFLKEHKNNALLKNSALLGLIGQIFNLIALAAGMANIWLLKVYYANPAMNTGSIYIVSILSQAGYILRLAAIFLLGMFFLRLYQYLEHKSFLKQSALLVFIGEAAVFVIKLVIRVFLNGVTMRTSESTAATFKMIVYIGNDIEFIPLIFLTIFFIVLYKGQGQIEGSRSLQV